jgi:DNA-binding phage protein
MVTKPGLLWDNWQERMMSKTATTRYDVAEHFRTPEEMAAYLEVCLEEAEGDASFIAKALGLKLHAECVNIAAKKSWSKAPRG